MIPPMPAHHQKGSLALAEEEATGEDDEDARRRNERRACVL
jgi:hypothetical protein